MWRMVIKYGWMDKIVDKANDTVYFFDFFQRKCSLFLYEFETVCRAEWILL